MFIPCVHYSKTICEGLTTLFIASASSHVEVVKTLLEYGRDTIDVRFDLQTRFDCPVHILPRWLSPFHSLHPLSRAHALNATFYIKLRCWLVILCHFLRSIVWALCIAGEQAQNWQWYYPIVLGRTGRPHWCRQTHPRSAFFLNSFFFSPHPPSSSSRSRYPSPSPKQYRQRMPMINSFLRLGNGTSLPSTTYTMKIL